MTNADKTKQQLIEEVEALRSRTAEAQAALRESEEKYRALIDEAPIGICHIDLKGNITYVNKSFEEGSGYSRKELIGKNGLKLGIFTNETVKYFAQRLKARLRGKPSQHMEIQLKRKDGGWIWVAIDERMIKKWGVPVGFQLAGTDITERKRMEEELRESEERYRGIFDKVPASIMLLDKDGRIVDINPYHIINIAKGKTTAKDYLGKNIVARLSIANAGLSETYARLLKGEPFDLKEVYFPITSAGGDGYFNVKGVPLFKDGEVTGGIILLEDITERKQAEEALRESEERYRALVHLGAEVGESIIALQDNEQGLAIQTFVNDEWPRITGYSREELLTMSFFDLVHPEYREASVEGHRRKMAGESIPGVFELLIIRKNGTEVPIELTGAYTKYKGKLVHVTYIRDITERKRAEAERKELEQRAQLASRLAAVGEMTSGIAHEINNPLTSIIGFAQLVMDRNIPDDIRKDIGVIYSEAQRTAEVVKNLLTFARKHAPVRQPTDINSIINGVLELRAYEHRVNNIQVNTRFDPKLPETMVDYFQMQQVFLNIILNSETTMLEAHNKGTLTITTQKVNSTIKVSFTDDGTGIAKENLSRIFDPFFTTTEVGKGTGLGLSICHGIVAEHGGRIYARSKLGKGATFVVELPINAD